MRSIRRDNRDAIFERLEGWWNDSIVNLLVGKRADAIFGYEISDKLSRLPRSTSQTTSRSPSEERCPQGEIGTQTMIRACLLSNCEKLGIASNRIRNAILDYYRAF